MLSLTNYNIINILPEILILLSSLVLLLIGVFNGNSFALKQIGLSKFILVFVAVAIVMIPNESNVSFNNMFITNGYTNLSKYLVLIGGLMTLFLASGFYKDDKNKICEFPVLILLAIAGMFLMISANGLLSFYMGLELQSLALYILAAINRNDEKSSEAGLKYFILGAVSTGIKLYGCSLIYGFAGTENFDNLRVLYSEQKELSVGVLVGMIFLITGICFKISAVPFHMWTPDVYEGSPMPVTAFFAVAPKIAAVSVFTRLLLEPFADAVSQWQQIIIFISAASMIVGALGAIGQLNIKRLIAYSSIGHIGYILVGLAAASREGVMSILFYLIIYMTLSVGIFACIMMIKRKEGESEDIYSLSGLAKSKPYLALFIAILMLSMAGIPPFAGFFGKFFIFKAAIESQLYVLAVIGVLSSVIAAFYYLRIIKIMYFDESVVPLENNDAGHIKHIAFVSAMFNALMFLGFSFLLNYTLNAAAWLF